MYGQRQKLLMHLLRSARALRSRRMFTDRFIFCARLHAHSNKLQFQVNLCNRRVLVKGVQGMRALSLTALTSGQYAENRLDLVIKQYSSM